jgi:RNA polymerase sigma factor (sigma-70 family)
MITRTETLTDAEIISSLLNDRDSDAAIRFLYRSHYETLGRYVVNNSGSWDDAQDIFQEVIIAFVNLVKAGKFRGESSIKTFLYSLNKNIWLNELKKRGRSQIREMKYEERASDRTEHGVNLALEARETNSELMKVMDELGENCKKILLLYYYENQSMKEILTSLNYENEQVVRNKKYKCLKRLEELITENKSLYHQLKNLLHG